MFIQLVALLYSIILQQNKQYTISNPKSLPYACLAFSQDGSILLAGESMTRFSNIHHFEFNDDEQAYTKKVLIKTQFHTIERVSISLDNSIFVVNGVSKDPNKNEIMRFEVYDIEKKKMIKSYRVTKKIISNAWFYDTESRSFLILTKDALLNCEEKGKWDSRNISIGHVGGKLLGMVESEEDWKFILTEDKKLIRVEGSKDITDIYDLENIIEDTPTAITSYKDQIWIWCLNGLVYVSNYINPHDLFQQPLPAYFGLGAAEEAEVKEYPDTMICRMDEEYMWWVYSDKTLVVFKRDTEFNFKIDHLIQNHAKAIYNMQILNNESSERGFSFFSGSSDKTIRKWKVDYNKEGITATQYRIGLLWDEFSHLKKKTSVQKPQDDDDSEELGQIRALKALKIGTQELIFCGDSWGYIWIFNSKTLVLLGIEELHEDEILDIAAIKLVDEEDSRHNLLVSCSRDHTLKFFKYIDDACEQLEEITDNPASIIGIDFIEEAGSVVKAVYIDAKSNLWLRKIKENLTIGAPIK